MEKISPRRRYASEVDLPRSLKAESYLSHELMFRRSSSTSHISLSVARWSPLVYVGLFIGGRVYAPQRNGYLGNRSNPSGGYDVSLRLVAFRSTFRSRKKFAAGVKASWEGRDWERRAW